MYMNELMCGIVPDDGSVAVDFIPRRGFYDQAITTNYFKEREWKHNQNGSFP